MLSRTSESLLGVEAGLILWANSMPSNPNKASTKRIRKKERELERRELPAMFRNPRAGTWRDPTTPSDAVYHAKAPVSLDANGGGGLHSCDTFGPFRLGTSGRFELTRRLPATHFCPSNLVPNVLCLI